MLNKQSINLDNLDKIPQEFPISLPGAKRRPNTKLDEIILLRLLYRYIYIKRREQNKYALTYTKGELTCY